MEINAVSMHYKNCYNTIIGAKWRQLTFIFKIFNVFMSGICFVLLNSLNLEFKSGTLSVTLNQKYNSFSRFRMCTILFHLYICLPDSQESVGGALHSANIYRDLLPETPRYCYPVENLYSTFFLNFVQQK